MALKGFVQKHRSFIQIFTVVFVFVWLLASGFSFFYTTTNNEIASFEDTLESVAKNNANSVSFSFEKYTHFLIMMSDFLRNASYDETYFGEALNDIKNLEDFSNIAVILPNGESYVTNGTSLSLANYPFVERMENRETFVSEVYYDEYAACNAVSVNVPLISDDGELVAYLVGILGTDILSGYFNQTFYDVGGYYLVLDSKGHYVALSDSAHVEDENRSFWDLAEDIGYVNDYTSEELVHSLDTQTAGVTRYAIDDVKRTAYFTPIAINEWMMYSVIPDTIISVHIDTIVFSAVLLMLNITLLFSVLLFLVYRTQRALTQYAEENERNFRFVAEQTDKWIAEWDFSAESVKLTGKLQAFLGTEKHTKTISFAALQNTVHPEDLFVFTHILNALKNEHSTSDGKVRLRLQNGSFVWCMLSGVPIHPDKRKKAHSRAIGFIENIDELEKEAVLLKEMSELDTLTKTYNKGTTESLIEKTIAVSSKNTDKHSLLILDLDNFKSINDTFGHQFGDDVIRELASYLSGIVRHNDVVGRIGGDEFFVFLKDTLSDSLVVEKCQSICTHFHKSYEKDGKSVSISASIGVANYPAHGTSFSQLYQHADIALYHVKEQGKNNYEFYNSQMHIEYTAQRTQIDS